LYAAKIVVKSNLEDKQLSLDHLLSVLAVVAYYPAHKHTHAPRHPSRWTSVSPLYPLLHLHLFRTCAFSWDSSYPA